MYKMCTLLQAIGINIYYLANCTDSDKFLQRFKYVGLNTKVSSQPGEQTQQEGWNGDICSNGVARPKEQVNVFQQFFKIDIIPPETFAAHNGPQNVDNRDDENNLEIDYVMRVGLGLNLDFVNQISNFSHRLTFYGCFSEAHVPQLANGESTLFTPKFPVSENHTWKDFMALSYCKCRFILSDSLLYGNKPNFSPNVRARITEFEGLPFKSSLFNASITASGPTTEMKGWFGPT